jgi:Arc/MetJ-type ribon-helix-helix transcriptional regulator
MNAKRTHVVLSERLVRDIDALVGSRRRSSFIGQAAEKELMRLRQIKALEAAAGSWKDRDHPELKQGAARWVDKLRRRDGQRFQKAAAR